MPSRLQMCCTLFFSSQQQGWQYTGLSQSDYVTDSILKTESGIGVSANHILLHY